MDDELTDLARRAAGPTTSRPVDLSTIRDRVRRRRSRHQALGGGALSVVLLLVVALNLRTTAPTSVDVVDVGLDTTGLRVVDYDDPFLPTLLPEGYDRCSPTQVLDADDSVAATTFCSETGDLTLLTGDHDTLPELGDPFAMGARTGYSMTVGRGLQLTVSDATRADDTHYRLIATDPGLGRGTVAAIIASIPAYTAEVSTPTP